MHDAADQDAGDARHRHAGEARADQAPGRAVVDPARAPAGSRECRRSRSPRRTGAGLDRQQQSRRSSSRAAACVVSVAAASSITHSTSSGTGARARPGEQQRREQRRGRDLHHAGDREIGAQHVARATDRRCPPGRRPAAPRSPPRRRTSATALQAASSRGPPRDAVARRPSCRRQRTGQQHQEQHAAERHRLRDDGQSMDDDRQIAEQIDQQRHALSACHGEGHVAAGDVAVDRQHLPANDITARQRELGAGADHVGWPAG